MGILGKIRNSLAQDSIDRNGLASGTMYENCEQCRYRVDDPKSNYWICARYRIHVSSKQVCGYFERGDSIYRST